MSSSIESADEALANASNRRPSAVDSLPATCRLSFEDVTSSSVAIFLTEIPSSVVSFNIWCSQENEDIFSKGPVSSFLSDRRPIRIFVSSLQPGTKYTFRAVAYGDHGEVGCSQAICSTKSVDRNHENSSPPGPAGVERDCDGAEVSGLQAVRDMHSPPTAHGHRLDLNPNEVDDPVPDLNEGDDQVPDLNKGADPVLDLNKDNDPVPEDLYKDDDHLNGCNRDEANRCTLEGAVRARGDAVPHGTNNDQAKVLLTAEALGSNCALFGRLPLEAPEEFDENFEDCVRVIRRLECNGHLETEFRMMFLTWFSLSSTADDRFVVSTFIEALGDDEGSLAAQLVDTFSNKISHNQ